MTLNYNAPAEGQKSGIDKGGNADQMQSFFWLRNSIIQARKEMYFMPLADVTKMPKHYGKTMKLYEYVPLLDARNVNDQGIDANGVTIANGNLYGSSKDVGTIKGKLPVLTENGGRVNRVGFTRIEREGSIHKFGYFYEFTKEAIDFDSDDKLKDHLSRECMNAAVQMTEAALQIDLLLAAGVTIYGGAATKNDELTAEVVGGAPASFVTYEDFMRMDQILTDNRTPRQTTIITGSKNIDTMVIGSTRIMYCGSELVPYLKRLKDLHDRPAFIAPQYYAAAGTLLNGEVGSIGDFRIIQVPEMLNWSGEGAVVGTNPGYRSSIGKDGQERYDVFPMLTIGDKSFTNIGFQTDGDVVKFDVITKMPGRETAERNEPYGELGFSSIKWYYGILILRPERIGLIKTVAPI